MIIADERARDGLELFDIDGTESFEMKNETLKMCADDDGTIWFSCRTLNLLDENGDTVFSLSWSDTGVCGTIHNEDFQLEIKEEL